MENIMILVTGMPGTGKTTFAAWLSSKLHVPLVSYDNIAKKTMETAKTFNNPDLIPQIMGNGKELIAISRSL